MEKIKNNLNTLVTLLTFATLVTGIGAVFWQWGELSADVKNNTKKVEEHTLQYLEMLKKLTKLETLAEERNKILEKK